MPPTKVPFQAASGDIVVRGLSKKVRDIEVRMMQIRFKLTAASPFYGPFSIPAALLEDRAIMGAYAPPFAIMERSASQPNPSAGDTNVIRPVFSVRGTRSLIMFAGNQFANANAIGAIGSNAVIDAPIEKASMRFGLPGDARYDIASPYGAEVYDHKRHSRIVSVANRGASTTNPSSHTVYEYTLNSGHTVRIELANAVSPASVGDVYPTNQESTREDYDVGAVSRSLEATYPRQNGFAIPDLSDDFNDNRYVESDGLRIQSVKLVADYPDNPSSFLKEITFVNGTTVRKPLSQTAVVGEYLGDSTTADTPQETLATNEWHEMMVFLLLGRFPDVNSDGLSGIESDPWPINVAGTTYP
jgi:hypothetical protein